MKLVEAKKAYSSFIESIGYNEEAQRLVVTMKGGKNYLYGGVSREVYEEFAASKNKGSYFSKNIRPNYEFLKINLG